MFPPIRPAMMEAGIQQLIEDAKQRIRMIDQTYQCPACQKFGVETEEVERKINHWKPDGSEVVKVMVPMRRCFHCKETWLDEEADDRWRAAIKPEAVSEPETIQKLKRPAEVDPEEAFGEPE